MSRRLRLLCSVPVIALWLLAAGPARGADGAPLVDVKERSEPLTLPAEQSVEQTWTVQWDELFTDQGDAAAPDAGMIFALAQQNTPPPKAPPIIAAPLPPAIVSAVIGLIGVYAYKRRHRLR